MMLASTYPYFTACLVLIAMAAIGIALYGTQRRPMILSAILSAPFAATSVFFVPEYWNPVRLLSAPVGIEDILFSFANGAIVWFLATWLVRKQLTLTLQPGRLIRRYVGFSALGTCLAYLLISTGMGIMTAALVSFLAIGLLLMRRCRHIWHILLSGSLGFTAIYVTITFSSIAIWPNFIQQWNANGLWGYAVRGLPLEEIFWAIGYGAVWPLFMAYVFDARLSDEQVQTVQDQERSAVSVLEQ